jgi:hypothetical protein
VPASWVTAACLIAALLAGCGGAATSVSSAVSPQRILSEAIAAAHTVRSYRIEATGAEGLGRFSATLEVDGPQRLSATLDLRSVGMIRLMTLGLFSYFNAPRAYWATLPDMTPSEVAAFSGRWLKVPTGISAEVKSVASRLGSLRQIARCWSNSRTSLSYIGRGDLDGHPVVILANRGAAPGSAPGKVYVSATPPKLPLRTVVTGPQKPGASADCRSTVTAEVETLSDFNQRFDISPPPHAISLGGSGETVVDDRRATGRSAGA